MLCAFLFSNRKKVAFFAVEMAMKVLTRRFVQGTSSSVSFLRAKLTYLLEHKSSHTQMSRLYSGTNFFCEKKRIVQNVG